MVTLSGLSRSSLVSGSRGLVRAALIGFAVVASSGAVVAQEVASDWVEGHNVRSRLVIGTFGRPMTEPPGAQAQFIFAGLEMELGEGWKTYWRFPGDAGGVPPEFDFAGSSNVAETHVQYPAPMRMTDRSGSTIGYKKHVVFPISVTPEKTGEAVTLKLQLIFGVCREICVPSEGAYEVTLPAGAKPPLPQALATALVRVPDGFGSKSKPPILSKTEAALDGDAPKLTLHVAFPEGAAGADVFIEGPPGEFVPLPRQVGQVDDKTLIFEVDLTKGADVKALKGQPLRTTIVSDSGARETTFLLQEGQGPIPPKP